MGPICCGLTSAAAAEVGVPCESAPWGFRTQGALSQEPSGQKPTSGGSGPWGPSSITAATLTDASCPLRPRHPLKRTGQAKWQTRAHRSQHPQPRARRERSTRQGPGSPTPLLTAHRSQLRASAKTRSAPEGPRDLDPCCFWKSIAQGTPGNPENPETRNPSSHPRSGDGEQIEQNPRGDAQVVASRRGRGHPRFPESLGNSGRNTEGSVSSLKLKADRTTETKAN